MKKIYALFLLLFLSGAGRAQSIYIARNAVVSFYSSAPIEDIKATTDQAVSALNTTTKAIYFKLGIRSFRFLKSLMQEHFNEDYMESDKYPYAIFNGRITDSTDITKEGHYNITVTGDLTIHNVTKAYTTPGTLEVKGGSITAQAVFKVKLADHDIKIPRLVIKNIAEVVQVTVNAHYAPQLSP